MSKKVTERSRGSRVVKNVLKVKKVAKTGAERIRAYRARIKALKNAAAAESANNIEDMARQTASQLYGALSRQSSQDLQETGDNHRQFVAQVDVLQQDLPLLLEVASTSPMQMQSSTQKLTKLRRHSKIAKTPAERARAYRRRKKALKIATNTQLMIDATHSHVDETHSHVDETHSHVDETHSHVDPTHSHVDATHSYVDALAGLGESQEAIDARTSTARSQQCGVGKRLYEHVVEAPSSPFTSGSSYSGVESSAALYIPYKPTLWYYKHLNFLSGNKGPDSEDSDLDQNDDTVFVQLPHGKKRAASSSVAQEEVPDTSTDASAAAFGRSVGAQLHHLTKMQRCIAEKLISDVIYHAKMEQLSLDTTIDVKEAADDPDDILTPKPGSSWYDTDTALKTGAQEPSSHTLETTEDLVKKEIAETESAVNFIKMERDETENYCFHDDEEQNHAIDIIKNELL